MSTGPVSSEIQAAALLKQLEQERGKDTLSMGKLGKSKGKGKIPMFSAWFNDLKVPFGAEEVAKQLLRRACPSPMQRKQGCRRGSAKPYAR